MTDPRPQAGTAPADELALDRAEAGAPAPGPGPAESEGAPTRTEGGGKPSKAGSSTARMAKGGSLNVIGALVQQICLFLITALLGHALGKTEVGRYSEGYGLLSLLGVLSLAGFRAGLTRFIAIFLAEDDPARVRGTVKLGMGITVTGAVIFGAVLAWSAPAFARMWFHDPEMETAIRLVALALPAAATSDAALSATTGWRTQKAFSYIGRMFDPATTLFLTGLFVVLLGYGLNWAFGAVAISAWLTCILSLIALSRRLRNVPAAKAIMEPRRIFGFSMVSWFSALAATGLIWADTLILGNLATAGDVGVYHVAGRVVMFAVFVMAPITNAFSPHMAHLYHLGDLEEAAKAYGNATRWIVMCSVPAFVMLLVFPGELLRVFGPEFPSGAAVTMILAIGQFMVAATGPCGVVLNMSGRVRLSLIDNIGVLVLNIALCYLLIPPHGVIGAAWAWTIALCTVNTVKYLQARYLVGIQPVGAHTPTLVGLGFVVAALAVGVREVLPDEWWVVVPGAVVVLAGYAAGLALRPHPADAQIARRLLKRAGIPVGYTPRHRA